jgi:serine/threonine-protein kinase
VRASPSRRPRTLALAALAAVALIAGAAVGASHDNARRHSAAAGLHPARHTTTAAPVKPRHHAHRPTPAPAHTAAATSSSTTDGSGSAGTGAQGENASATSGGSPDALEARGHALMEAGQYAQAIPILRQAVAAAPHSSLTYAYALYDLGRSLRLAGDPAAAIPILQARLQIPNQTDVVRHELELAMQAAGASSAGAGPAKTPASDSGGAAPKHDGPPGKRKHKHGGD